MDTNLTTVQFYTSTMNTTELPPTKGFAILIKAPGAAHFVPREGETITITDKTGKELWRIKDRIGADNPGVIIYNLQIDLLTQREFGKFAQNAWTGRSCHPATPLPPTNPT
jgi:hypothetical protein